ncbi:MAG: ATP-binding protein [Caloramator sp.]|nr:ATP-binding protein [Caloramator sp.]
MSRIRVFTGHFGSGKTEIAINYALKLNEEGKKVAIADLDIVNPYFCTRDQTEYLEEKGIKVIATPKEFSNAELGTVPLNTLTVFNDKSYEVVLDVGGDDQGAVALGQYNKYFREEDYDMYFVINTTRPLTSDANSIIKYIDEIQRASRLKVKYLVNNTNLSYETTVDMIKEGYEIVKEVSEKINIPIAFTAVREDLALQVKEEIGENIFPIKIFMLPPWRRELE